MHRSQVCTDSTRVINQVIAAGVVWAASLSFTASTNLTEGEYYWRVRAYAGGMRRLLSQLKEHTL